MCRVTTTSGTHRSGNQSSVNGNTVYYYPEGQVGSVVDGATTMYYNYDGQGNRVIKNVPSGTTVYVYDANNLLAAEYSTVPQSASPCLTCYVTTDHLGSTRLVTDQNGAVIARHDYAPFGEEVTGRGAGWGPGTDNIHQKFTGQERDTESGMDFFQARYYGSALGRFTSPDPWNAGADPMNPQSWNMYAYVNNNPLNATDPSGLTTCDANGDNCYDSTTVNGGSVDPVPGDNWPSGSASWYTGYTFFGYGYGGGGGGSSTAHIAQQVQQFGQQLSNWLTAPRDPGCMQKAAVLGAGLGTGIGATAGSVGMGTVGGFVGSIVPGAGNILGAAGGTALGGWGGGAIGGGVGYVGGLAIGYSACMSSNGGTGEGKGGHRDKTRGANANDKQQVKDAAREEGVDANRFGKWLEAEKRAEGRSPSDNYPYDELKELAKIYKAEGGR